MREKGGEGGGCEGVERKRVGSGDGSTQPHWGSLGTFLC